MAPFFKRKRTLRMCRIGRKRVIADFFAVGLWCLATAILVVTILPLWNTNMWWVRIMAFPRLQIAIASVFVLVAALFMSGLGRLLEVQPRPIRTPNFAPDGRARPAEMPVRTAVGRFLLARRCSGCRITSEGLRAEPLASCITTP